MLFRAWLYFFLTCFVVTAQGMNRVGRDQAPGRLARPSLTYRIIRQVSGLSARPFSTLTKIVGGAGLLYGYMRFNKWLFPNLASRGSRFTRLLQNIVAMGCSLYRAKYNPDVEEERRVENGRLIISRTYFGRGHAVLPEVHRLLVLGVDTASIMSGGNGLHDAWKRKYENVN